MAEAWVSEKKTDRHMEGQKTSDNEIRRGGVLWSSRIKIKELSTLRLPYRAEKALLAGKKEELNCESRTEEGNS